MSEPQDGLIYALISEVMKEMPAIGKDQKNTVQNYKFRGIDSLYKFIHPLLAKYGVFCVPRVISSEFRELTTAKGTAQLRALLTIAHRFYAKDGSYVEVITLGEGLDTSDKASNKAMSAAMKYAFIELFSIPTEDIEDADKDHIEAGEPIHRITNVSKNGESFGI